MIEINELKYKLYLTGDKDSDICFIQPVFQYDKDQIESELTLIQEMTNNRTLLFVGFELANANVELSPWAAPPVRGDEGFGSSAGKTLSYIENEIIPYINKLSGNKSMKFILSGYSFAGLFALWAGYMTDTFTGIAAVSPSVWFPQWDEFINNNEIKARKVYLSLGKKEYKTRNPLMSNLEERIHLQYDLIGRQMGYDNCILEWNPGNHFMDVTKRKAKGVSWLINETE